MKDKRKTKGKEMGQVVRGELETAIMFCFMNIPMLGCVMKMSFC